MGSEDVNNPALNGNLSARDNKQSTVKLIERYLIISMAVLILAILLIVIRQYLFAGCCILAAASMGIIIYRKFIMLNSITSETLSILQKNDSRKDRIITSFSHKIREPLNNLVITGEMLAETKLDNKQKELLDTFLASTKSMVGTVNELTMHSAENMSHEFRKQIRFNILSTIEHVIELYRLKDKPGLSFDVSVTRGGNPECIGDPVIIKQIFLDIIGRIENGIHSGSAKVSVNVDTSQDGLLKMEIRTDKMAEIVSEKNPEEFQAARLVAMSKGKLTLETEENALVLTITLGIRQPVPEEGPKASPTRIEELITREKTKKDLKDIKVLLVEDNIINQKITLLTLQPLVSGIDSAANGKEALEMFGTSNYDLILMDIQMPVMNGLTAIEKIRSLESSTNSHVPIIAITANAMIGDKEKCLSAGADDYISKPFQPLELVKKIKQVI